MDGRSPLSSLPFLTLADSNWTIFCSHSPSKMNEWENGVNRWVDERGVRTNWRQINQLHPYLPSRTFCEALVNGSWKENDPDASTVISRSPAFDLQLDQLLMDLSLSIILDSNLRSRDSSIDLSSNNGRYCITLETNIRRNSERKGWLIEDHAGRDLESIQRGLVHLFILLLTCILYPPAAGRQRVFNPLFPSIDPFAAFWSTCCQS